MPKDWPSDNISNLTAEISKLKEEIKEEEMRIALIIDNNERQIALNLLESKKGLLVIRNQNLSAQNKADFFV